METLAPQEFASPETEPELHLLLERDRRDDWRRWRSAAIVSVAFHVVLLVVLLLMPESEARIYREELPILRVTPQAVEVEYRAGDPAPEAGVLLVSATWPRLPYSLTRGGEPWLRVEQQTGMTPLAGSPYAGDVVRIEILPEKLPAGRYEASLVFSGPPGSAAVTVPVRLRVTGAK